MRSLKKGGYRVPFFYNCMQYLPRRKPGLKLQTLLLCVPFFCAKVGRVRRGLPVLTFLFCLNACSPAKKTIYFQNLSADTTLSHLINKNFETKILPGDLLSISIASLSPDVAFYNAPQNTSGSLSGYLVDEAGTINFIKLGTFQVEGLTKKELKAKLETDLVPYLKEAVVSIGILNRHVTMLGAAGPQVLPMGIENMTILDALASSGDIGERGKTDNVLVIREEDSSKVFKRLNLTDQSVFYSSYYYLQPNDIIYVEPVKAKKISTPQIISYITAGISFIFLILNQVLRL